MTKRKVYWLKIERASPFVVMAVLGLTILIFLLSALSIGFFLIRGDSSPSLRVSLDSSALLITQPSANQALTGQTSITLAYSDGRQFSNVKFLVDDQSEFELEPIPSNEITFSLDTAEFADGNHTFSFEAVTNNGEVSTTAVGVVIANDQEASRE